MDSRSRAGRRPWIRGGVVAAGVAGLVLASAPASQAQITTDRSACITSSNTRWTASTELLARDTGPTVNIGVGTKGLFYKTNCASTASKTGTLEMTWTITVSGKGISCAVGVPLSASCGGTSSERTFTVTASGTASSLSRVIGTSTMYFRDTGDAKSICSSVSGTDAGVSRILTEGCLSL